MESRRWCELAENTVRALTGSRAPEGFPETWSKAFLLKAHQAESVVSAQSRSHVLESRVVGETARTGNLRKRPTEDRLGASRSEAGQEQTHGVEADLGCWHWVGWPRLLPNPAGAEDMRHLVCVFWSESRNPS